MVGLCVAPTCLMSSAGRFATFPTSPLPAALGLTREDTAQLKMRSGSEVGQARWKVRSGISHDVKQSPILLGEIGWWPFLKLANSQSGIYVNSAVSNPTGYGEWTKSMDMKQERLSETPMTRYGARDGN
jgi:hypothetical protein